MTRWQQLRFSMQSCAFVFLSLFFLLPASARAGSQLHEDGDFSPWNSAFEEAEAFFQEGVVATEDKDWLKAEESYDLALNSLASVSPKDSSQSKQKKAYINRIIDALADISAQSLAARISEGMTPDNPDFYSESEIPTDSNTQYLLHHLVDGIDLGKFELPIEVNDRVIREMYYLLNKSRDFTQGSLIRMSRYQTYISDRLRSENVPKELIYLALIESGFKPSAVSGAKAAGLWQFMPVTGKLYGLDLNWYVDQRRDPYMATDAAVRYLKHLYNQFGDWYLAMAAYNCGEGCVRKAMKNSKDSSYWKISLPKETQAYVPRILAAAIIGSNPQKYDLKPPPPPLAKPDTITIPGCVSVDKLAQITNSPTDSIAFLNQALRQRISPAGQNSMVYLPVGGRKLVAKAMADQGNTFGSCMSRHRVDRGESWTSIARKYGISTDQILKANNLSHPVRLHKGQLLTIPPNSNTGVDTTAKTDSTTINLDDPLLVPAVDDDLPDYYSAKRGDNLVKIANKFNLKVSDLKSWNNLDENSIHKSIRLRLKAPAPAKVSPNDDGNGASKDDSETKTLKSNADNNFHTVEVKQKIRHIHTVGRGEDLGDVSSKLGVDQDQLIAWNSTLKRHRTLHRGQELVWYQEKTIKTLEPNRAKKKATDDESDDRPSKKQDLPKSVTISKTMSLEQISDKYEISIANLRLWNHIQTGHKPKIGTVILLSKANPNKEIRKKDDDEDNGDDDTPTARTVVITRQLTLDKISDKYDVSIAQLRIWNHLKPGQRPKIGSKILIANPNAKKVAQKDDDDDDDTYIVKKGDSLQSIAKKFHISQSELKKWNGIKGERVALGAKLKIKEP